MDTPGIVSALCYNRALPGQTVRFRIVGLRGRRYKLCLAVFHCCTRTVACSMQHVMFRSGVLNLQLRAVCTEELGIHHTYIFINRGTTTKSPVLLFVRLAKMSRVFNSLVTGQTATDSANFFASSVGWAQPTLVVRCRALSRSREGGTCFDLE